MKHTQYDLKQMQSLPLEAKIAMTQQRIRQWYEYWEGNVYVSFSGGKDSTVLKHIVDGMYSDIPAVFVNTGLEYPEIQRFAREIKAGKYGCFNTDVEIVRPEMRFDEVLKKYGYPVGSKETADKIEFGRKTLQRGDFQQYERYVGSVKINKKTGEKYIFRPLSKRFMKLFEAEEIPVSQRCCSVMKKRPIKKL